MATLLQDEGVIEVQLVLLGSAHATQPLWERLERFTRTRQGDALIIPERRTAFSPTGPLSEHLFRVEVKRLILDEQPTPQRLVESLNLADGFLLAVDITPEESGLTREVMRLTEQAMALLDPSGWVRARALLGVSGPKLTGEAPLLWSELRVWWHRHAWGDWTCSALTQQVDDEFVGEALHAVGSRVRNNFTRRPPGLHPIYPQQDLPDHLRADAERHQKNLRRAEPDVRADAFWNLALLYGQAGQLTAARVLLRRAFETHRATRIWDARPPSRPPVTAIERLRQWELPKAQVGDVAFLPGGQTLLVAAGKTLLKGLRSAEALDELWRFDHDVRRLLPLDPQRMLVMHDPCIRLLAFEGGDLTTRAEAPLPQPVKDLLARQRDPRMMARTQALGDGTFKPFGMDLRADPKGDRLLLLSRAGVWLYRLSDLKPLHKIERTDLLDATFAPRAPGVLTLHDQGMVGLWTPGSSVLERVANLPARLRDGSLADGGFAVGVAEGSASCPLLMVSLKTGEQHGEAAPTVNASAVRVSAGGERVLTIEERYLRVRDTSQPLGPQTPSRTLLTPPPWVPARVAWSDGERQVAALCKAYTPNSDDPLMVYLWA